MPCVTIYTGSSCHQCLEFIWLWAQLEFALCPKNVFTCCFACHAAKDYAIQQGVTTQAVVSMHAAGYLACCIKAWDHSLVANNFRVLSDLQASHAVVDHWGDNCHVERFSSHFDPGMMLW